MRGGLFKQQQGILSQAPPPAVPTYINSAFAAYINAGTGVRVIATPADMLAGDLVVAWGACRNSYLDNMQTGGVADWTDIGETGSGNERVRIQAKTVVSPSETYGWAITDGGSDSQAMCIIAIRNASAVLAHSIIYDNHVAPSIAGLADTLLLSFHGTAYDAETSFAAPAGMTLIDIILSGTNNAGAAAAHESLTVAGATGTRSWTGWGSYRSAANVMVG